jgi:GTP-binding protein EngB required for normal cell division
VPHVSPELSASLDAVERLLRDDALAAWPTRDDDLALVGEARERLERRFTLAVVGEFSSGKSFLLNALLGKARFDANGRVAGLLATDINPSTATITELEYGATESAIARYPSGRTERIPLDSLSRFVAVGKNDAPGAIHDATADEDAAPAFVVVSIDSPFLASGFAVADTPGLASLNPAHRRATLNYLPRTDAVLYLIDTQQPFTEGDAAFLGLIGEHVRTIFIVQTKIDLWRMPEGDGGAAWEAARTRIALRAKRYAPEAVVYSVSAHDYAVGTLRDDRGLIEESGFPELLAGLERSLEIRAGQARIARTMSVLRDVTEKTANRVRRAAALDENDASTLHNERERALSVVVERERALVRERDDVARAGVERRSWIVAQGTALAERATRALGAAIDVADIERIRDRGKFHSLVDATVAPIWTTFAADVAGHVARALERIAKSRPDVRVVDLAARRLGGEPGTGAWSRDLASGITSTIVLGAIGGPTVAFVHGVSRAFAEKPHGGYMKRELGGDLAATLFPRFERDIAAFVEELAATLGAVYDDASNAIERERSVARAENLDPIDLALARAADPDARSQAQAAFASVVTRLGEIDQLLATVEAQLPAATNEAATGARNGAAGSESKVPFDADAYDRGLRPERYRVVLLGALRRGKSSLINAIAGTRLLQDEGGVEALFPIHVRYGERDRAYALEREGVWNEIPTGTAVSQAARSPVLIETPWTMPRQLVLVHAPAFDSGNPDAERIALAAAGAASEIVGLFSRQLSDSELNVYGRVAEFGKPMLLAHTIADNETAAERRTVVELAARYLRERNIACSRIFTISALDYLEAAQTKRAAAPWNELGALRETLATQAEEHMRKLADRARLEADLARVAAPPQTSGIRRSLGRIFGSSRNP